MFRPDAFANYIKHCYYHSFFQADEIEALSSIYSDDFQVEDEYMHKYSIKVSVGQLLIQLRVSTQLYLQWNIISIYINFMMDIHSNFVLHLDHAILS